MSPLQLAQAECANYEPNGACLGAHIGDRGEITYCSPKPSCVLRAGQRCTYFEECVAPMADVVKEPRRAKVIQEAVQSYRQAYERADAAGRKCPDCGSPLQKFRQMCPPCAEKRRKATFRDAQHRRRYAKHALSTEVQKSTPNSLGKSHSFPDVFGKPYRDSGRPENGSTSVDTTATAAARRGRGAAA